MTRRLRILLPPGGVLLGLALPYALLELPYWFIRLRWGVIVPTDKHPSVLLLVFASLAYGVYRVAAFHPFYRPGYREWLERTPWTSRKPLPAGPVAWVWEDGLVLGAFAALASTHAFPDPTVIATLPLISYGLALTVTFFPTGAWASGYASALALGLPVWLSANRWAFLGSAVGANFLVYFGLRQSLANFPWPQEWARGWWHFLKFDSKDPRVPTKFGCGWPHERLHPNVPDQFHIDLADAALLSLLAGWWLFALCSLITDSRDRFDTLSLVLIGGTAMFGCGRLTLYCAGFAPPIGLWGRIVTFRWIIPGYDRVYIGPACTMLTPVLGFVLLRRRGVPGDVVLPLCFSLMMFVALSSKPSLRNWRLTGRHRITPGLINSNNGYIQVG